MKALSNRYGIQFEASYAGFEFTSNQLRKKLEEYLYKKTNVSTKLRVYCLDEENMTVGLAPHVPQEHRSLLMKKGYKIEDGDKWAHQLLDELFQSKNMTYFIYELDGYETFRISMQMPIQEYFARMFIEK